MSVNEGLFAWVEEALAPLGTVTMRKMMGGATLYLDNVVFAILYDGEIWFKSDALSDAVWDAEGCERFSVTFKDGRVDTMNSRRAPGDVHDDSDAMRHWAAPAIEAGVRGAARRKPKTGSKSKSSPRA
jgi:DNA transformation protein